MKRFKKNQIKIGIQMTRREQKSMRFPSTTIEMKSYESEIRQKMLMERSHFLCPKRSIIKMMIPIQGPFWNVFGPIVITPENINLVGYKWVVVRKVT